MSAPQFTPGPWDALPKASYVHVADKGHVAKITNPWNDRVEREANVHLIAAAPELYADNEFAAGGMDEVATAIKSVFPLHAEGLRVAAKRLRATAAKARGDA